MTQTPSLPAQRVAKALTGVLVIATVVGFLFVSWQNERKRSAYACTSQPELASSFIRLHAGGTKHSLEMPLLAPVTFVFRADASQQDVTRAAQRIGDACRFLRVRLMPVAPGA